MFRYCASQQWWNRIADLPLLFLHMATENKRVIEALESSGFANRDTAMVAIVDEAP